MLLTFKMSNQTPARYKKWPDQVIKMSCWSWKGIFFQFGEDDNQKHILRKHRFAVVEASEVNATSVYSNPDRHHKIQYVEGSNVKKMSENKLLLHLTGNIVQRNSSTF